MVAKDSLVRSSELAKEDLMAALKKCVEKLGRVPNFDEFRKATGVRKNRFRRLFGTYRQALKEAGLERRGSGYPVPMEDLFMEWAGIVRKLGRVPTMTDYESNSRHSVRPLLARFKNWMNVPAGLAQYAQKSGLEGEWKDVLDVAVSRARQAGRGNWTSTPAFLPALLPVLRLDRPIFGESFSPLSMTHAPTNENGVIFLFGMLAAELGFAVMKLQSEFPDCKAMRRVDEKRWQEVWIELEFESRNFLLHGHPPDGCDLIVCWEHNWPECPLEVVELKSALARRMQAK